MAGLRETVDECDFRDLGFTGVPFTWDNGQDGDANVKIRLDRMLVNPAMEELYVRSVVRHAPSPKSDHCLLITKLRKLLDDDSERGPRPFMYENAWRREDSYEAAVSENWLNGSGAGGLVGLQDALVQMQVGLSDWSSKKFGNIRKRIKKCRKEFERERANSLFRGTSIKEKELARHLNELLKKEEIMAKQRSRVDWLKAGTVTQLSFMQDPQSGEARIL
jgi:hypothetical protein